MNYEITFLKPRAEYNWVSVSSITKEEFLGFIITYIALIET